MADGSGGGVAGGDIGGNSGASVCSGEGNSGELSGDVVIFGVKSIADGFSQNDEGEDEANEKENDKAEGNCDEADDANHRNKTNDGGVHKPKVCKHFCIFISIIFIITPPYFFLFF